MTPVTYHWRPVWHVLPFLPYLVLVLLLCLKANRHRAAWAVLVPLGISCGALYLVRWSLASPSHIPMATGPAVFCFELAALLVLSHWLRFRRRLFSVLCASAIMAGAGLVGWAFSLSLDFSHQGWAASWYVSAISVALAITSAFVLASMIAAGFFCRKRWSPVRFRLALLCSMMLVGVPCIFVRWGTLNGFWLSVPAPAQQFLDKIVFATDTETSRFLVTAAVRLSTSLLMVLLTYVLMLPFLILAFRSPFYRERITAVFRFSDPGDANKEQAPPADPPSTGTRGSQ